MAVQNTETVKRREKHQVAINFLFCLRLVEKMGLNSSHQKKNNQTSNQMHATGIKYAKLYAGRSSWIFLSSERSRKWSETPQSEAKQNQKITELFAVSNSKSFYSTTAV